MCIRDSLETIHDEHFEPAAYAIEFAYSGSFHLRADLLADGNLLDEMFSATGVWISGILISLSDRVA